MLTGFFLPSLGKVSEMARTRVTSRDSQGPVKITPGTVMNSKEELKGLFSDNLLERFGLNFKLTISTENTDLNSVFDLNY